MATSRIQKAIFINAELHEQKKEVRVNGDWGFE